MPPQQPPPGKLSWSWILAGVVGTAALLAATVQVVDPTLQRPRVLVLIAVATLMLGGIVMGRVSPGETIVEGGVAGAVVFILAAGYLSFVRGVDLPGIGWTVLFSGDGVAIHSTFWHNDFGTPRSHGCVNALPDDAKFVWRWTQPSAPVDSGDVTISGRSSTQVIVIGR